MDQVTKVHKVSEELHAFLKELAGWITRSTTRQFIHAMGSGKRDEKELAEILDRFDRAKADLRTRILLVQVGLTGTLNDGFVAALPVIQRIDWNVQRVLGARLSIAACLEGKESSLGGMLVS
jgi:hypothetical protein